MTTLKPSSSVFSGSSPGLFGDDGLARRNNLGHSFLACENGKIRSDGYLSDGNITSKQLAINTVSLSM